MAIGDDFAISSAGAITHTSGTNIDVHVLSQPPRRKVVTKRDPQGRISEVIEE